MVVHKADEGVWVNLGGGRNYRVEPLTDRNEIAALLADHRAYAAYALGQLEDFLFPYSRWWLAHNDGQRAIICHSRGGLGNALFAMGDNGPLEAALLLHPGPMTTFATFQPEHCPVIQHFFHPQYRGVMLRMHVTAETFRPVAGPARRLHGNDMYEANRLYNSERPGGYYSAETIESGLYYGVFEEKRMIAIAGTHVVSPRYGIAVVGNVFTHPRHRGRGLATLVTSAVTSDLLVTCRDVVLTVDPNNTPAVRAYRRLGYQDAGHLIETAAIRRTSALMSDWLRRLSALWRGRKHSGHRQFI